MRYLFLILTLLLSDLLYSQKKELIKNGSFEDTIKLPNPNNFVLDNINNYLKFWDSPNKRTPDLFSNLFKDSLTLSSPTINFNYYSKIYFDYQLHPFKGNNFVGFASLSYLFDINRGGGNEYIRNIDVMVKKNHKFILTFKYAHYIRPYFSKKINIAFSKTNEDLNKPYLFKSDFKNNLILDLNLNESYQWDSVSQYFKSNDSYQSIVIGSLEFSNQVFNSKNDSTNMIYFGKSSYIYLDDISLIELPCIVSPDTVCNKSFTPLYTTLGMPYYWSSDRLGKDTLSKDSVFNFNGIKSQWIYAFGKYGKDSSFIHVMPFISNPFIKDTFHICNGKSQTLNAFIGNQFQYLWQTGETASSINVQKTGTSQVQISDAFSCKDSFKTNVVVHPLPKTYLAQDTINCFVSNPIITIRPQGNFTCFWQPLNLQNCEIQINKAQILQLKIKSIPYQCESDYEIVIKDICEPLVYIPNVFKPNSEIEVNQVFKPIVYYTDNYTMKIFNRWGEKVFETNNATDSWDGTFQGELCSQAVYLCVIELNSLIPNKTSKSYSQLVHLLR